MDLLQDQDARKSPSDNSTESFEQLESLVSREDDLLQSGSGNLLETDAAPTTTVANQNLNLDLLTEETGEGLPLNMQISMTASDHSTPEAPKPNLVEAVKETSVSQTESASNEPGGGDAIVPTSPSSLPQSEEPDDFYQFESRYESKKSETLQEEKIVEQADELIERTLIEAEDILERDIIKEEIPEVPSPLTKSFIEELDEREDVQEENVQLSKQIVPEVLQATIQEEIEKENDEDVIEDDEAKELKITEEPEVQRVSVQSAVVESRAPPVVSMPVVHESRPQPPQVNPSSLPGNQLKEKEEEVVAPAAAVEEKEEDHHPVVDLRTQAPSFQSSPPPIPQPAPIPISTKQPGPEPKREILEPPTDPVTVKPILIKKAAMEETAPQDCPFKSIGNYFVRDNLNPQLADLVFWKDPKKSGIAFGIGLIILFSLACCSVISVVSYTALTILTGSLGFRIYKSILQAVQKTNDGHPFKEYLELEVTLPNERVHQIVDIAVKHVNATILKLRSVFLAEDIIDSLKFVALFWVLTYIGSWFNGLTLIILAYLGAFSLPKVYEMHQAQIDQVLDMVCKQVSDVTNMVKSKIPFPAPKDKKQ